MSEEKTKKYEYAIAPTSQFFYCGVPFRFDFRPKCYLDCIYCFARSRGGRRTNSNQIADLEAFKRKFLRAYSSKNSNSDIVVEMIKRRMPIHLGGMSDPFSDDMTSSYTQELLKFLLPYKYPIILSTKMPRKLLDKDLFEVVRQYPNIIIQISLSTHESSCQLVLEPYAQPIESRILDMERLIINNIYVSCRIQPIIPKVTNLVAIIDILANIKCKHVILEYLKIPVEKSLVDFNILDNLLGESIRNYYKKNGATLIGREWILPTQHRYDIFRLAKRHANKKGISVSLADYGLYHLSDCRCCCGVDKFELDCNWHIGNFSTLIQRKPGLIYLKDMSEYWYSEKSIARYINSNSRLLKRGMRDYIEHRWNKPGSVNAPDSFLGVRALSEKDFEGNQVYINESHLWRC